MWQCIVYYNIRKLVIHGIGIPYTDLDIDYLAVNTD